jgi:hypothetical protein
LATVRCERIRSRDRLQPRCAWHHPSSCPAPTRGRLGPRQPLAHSNRGRTGSRSSAGTTRTCRQLDRCPGRISNTNPYSIGGGSIKLRLFPSDGLTGSYVFTFPADSDDVVPKSGSKRSPRSPFLDRGTLLSIPPTTFAECALLRINYELFIRNLRVFVLNDLG